jgi:hypothetical protein
MSFFIRIQNVWLSENVQAISVVILMTNVFSVRRSQYYRSSLFRTGLTYGILKDALVLLTCEEIGKHLGVLKDNICLQCLLYLLIRETLFHLFCKINFNIAGAF